MIWKVLNSRTKS